jgi:tetratricopeptide (TPR) repeat protein
MRLSAWNTLSKTFKHLPFLRREQQEMAEEARLYYRRACLAAAEERYDVALIFCEKACELDPGHLPTRLLAAQIHDYGLHDLEAAVAAYRKIITLAGYDGENSYCAAARAALDSLISTFSAGGHCATGAESFQPREQVTAGNRG